MKEYWDGFDTGLSDACIFGAMVAASRVLDQDGPLGWLAYGMIALFLIRMSRVWVNP